MAFGGRQCGRAGRVLWGLGLLLCALFVQLAVTLPAMAQNGSSEAGRVPVEGVPPGLSDGLKVLQREEPVPETLFEARRQAERAAQVAGRQCRRLAIAGGGGVEQKFGRNVSLGIEYLYRKLDDEENRVRLGRGTAAATSPIRT